MSKTDKTVPYRVTETRYGFESHSYVQHARGVCGPDYYKRWNLGCGVELPRHLLWKAFGRPNADQVEMRQQRRNQRHRDKRVMRLIMTGELEYESALFADHRYDYTRLPSW